MNSLIKLTSVVFMLGFFTACSSIQLADCEKFDPTGAGYELGREYNFDDSLINKYTNTCRDKFHFTVNTAAFAKGFERGLYEYCTRDQGLAIGRTGAPLPKHCPKATIDEVAKGYDVGFKEYQISEMRKDRDPANQKKLKELFNRQKCVLLIHSSCDVKPKCVDGACEYLGDACSKDAECTDLKGECFSDGCHYPTVK